MSWAEERRRDQQARREQDRRDRLADREQDRLDRLAEREQQRQDEQRRQADKAKKAKDRADRRAELWAAFTTWAPERGMWLLIMVTPMALAWTAMMQYGQHVYGPLGLLLPLFSEAVTIKLAFEIERRLKVDAPVALLRVGLVVFSAVQATLNYVHGASAVHQVVGGQPVLVEQGDIARGVVMALVSLGGVAVHQVVHGRQPRPRRTREQRRVDALALQAARRVHQVRAAAIRAAVPVLAEDGSVTLVHRPGPLAERRRVLVPWQRRVVPTVVPALPVPTLGEDLAEQVSTWLAQQSGTAGNSGNGATAGAAADMVPVSGTTLELVVRVRAAIASGELPAQPSRRKIQAFLGVRAETAQDVLRVMRDGDDGTVRTVS